MKSCKNNNIKPIDMAYTALGCALIIVCSWITVPAAVPFTMQTFGIFVTVGLLGTKRGAACVAAYIALGAVGLPVFSGFRGGIGVLLGTTGGYIIGFFLSALASGAIIGRTKHTTAALIFAMSAGLIICYAFGTAWFVLAYMRNVGEIGILSAISMCVVPFLLPDAVKIALAAVTVMRVSRQIKLR